MCSCVYACVCWCTQVPIASHGVQDVCLGWVTEAICMRQCTRACSCCLPCCRTAASLLITCMHTPCVHACSLALQAHALRARLAAEAGLRLLVARNTLGHEDISRHLHSGVQVPDTTALCVCVGGGAGSAAPVRHFCGCGVLRCMLSTQVGHAGGLEWRVILCVHQRQTATKCS